MSKNGLDKKTLVHIGGEVVAVTGITLYLVNRIAVLENRVAELEKDAQAAAKHQLHTEKVHNVALNKLNERISVQTAQRPQVPMQMHTNPQHGHGHPQNTRSFGSQGGKSHHVQQHGHHHSQRGHQNRNHGHSQHGHQHKSHGHHERHQSQKKHQPRVEEFDDDDDDDELLANEFGSESFSDDDNNFSQEDDSYEEPPQRARPPPPTHGKKKKKVTFTPQPKSAGGPRDMDDIKAKAAAMRARAGAE